MPKAPKPKCYIATNLTADDRDKKYAFLDAEFEMTGQIEKADIIIYDLSHKPATWPLYVGLPALNEKAEVIFTALDAIDDEHLELIKLCFQEALNYDLEVRGEPRALVNEIKHALAMKRKLGQQATQQLMNQMASMTVQWQKGAGE
jgi:hypothetical protein